MGIQIKRHFGVRFIAGVAMVMTGGLLLLQQAGYLHAINLGRSWPLILIAFAIVQLGTTMNKSRQRGWGLLLLGDWLFANTMTDWAYAQITWAILLTSLGAAMIVRAMRRGSRTARENYFAA